MIVALYDLPYIYIISMIIIQFHSWNITYHYIY